MLSGLLFDRLSAASRPAVSFNPRRCLRARFNGSTCLACVEECQSNALTFNGKAISFDAEKCTSCLRCSATCPNDALTDETDLELFFEAVRKREKIVLTCVKGRQCEGKVNIPCIGFLSEPILASLNILSKGKVILDIERCGDCINGHCLEKIRGALSSIASRNPESFLIKIVLTSNKEDIPGLERKIARRFFLKDAGKAIINSANLIAGDKNKSGQEDQRFKKNSTRNTLALNYVMAHTSDRNDLGLLGSYYYTLEATDNCTICPLCTGMCPTGALKRKKTDSSYHQLVFDGSRCSGCGLCVEFCNKDALTILPASRDTAGTTTIIS